MPTIQQTNKMYIPDGVLRGTHEQAIGEEDIDSVERVLDQAQSSVESIRAVELSNDAGELYELEFTEPCAADEPNAP